MAAEAKAYFLARILHLGLQDFDRMEKAPETCSWMEVATMRLYALIYVENAMRTMNASRATAWTAATPILESNPGTPALPPEFDSTLARTLAMNAKAQNAFRSMKTI
ncbi:hypothetical protein BWQ96_09824 [Gracilariopsis chorda]|uniref:Uncharacterized protein n=1 Tax=Gracilariopsis chorda TaxID=448386 RepID=A0A2V3IEK5_9FLOR|nr:hypothetical protein BWQ96_09824 [Gracilariopsis chorda]|eukprot:PXF40448.1 hypothetical protein BWQ96_09824 [Gracilariopsis chorda]